MEQAETTICFEREEENISPPIKLQDQEDQDSNSDEVFIFWKSERIGKFDVWKIDHLKFIYFLRHL